LNLLSKTELPIVRYYHWCFCDNFELAEGESARFGLVHIDYENQKRTIKNSGKFYSDIIKQRGVTEEVFKKYVKDQEYHF
jgi:beta-glucosidase